MMFLLKKIIINNKNLFCNISRYNFSTETKYPTLFKIKSKHSIKNESGTFKASKTNSGNESGISRHHPPLIKEWYNAICAYNKETTKTLSSYNNVVYSLIRGYLNFSYKNLENPYKSVTDRRDLIRKSVNRVWVGKPYFKHTHDNVTIMIYCYDRRLSHYTAKIDNTADFLSEKIGDLDLYNNSKLKKITATISTIIKKYNLMMVGVKSQNKIVSRNLNKDLYKFYLKSFLHNSVKDLFKIQLINIEIRQLKYIQESKINKFYITPLASLLEMIYRKKVLLNIVNIKYLFNSASILSQYIAFKLKNRSVLPGTVMKDFIDMHEYPYRDQLHSYDDIYGKKRILHNRKLKEFLLIDQNLKSKDCVDSFINENNNYTLYGKDMLEDIDKTMKRLKNKQARGVKIQARGRLTKRFTAQRSRHFMKHSGITRNTDSSDKGLHTPLLKGFVRYNLEYGQCNTTRRVGAYNVKAWIVGDS